MRIAVQITATGPTLPESISLAGSIAATWAEADLHVLATARVRSVIEHGTVTTVRFLW